MFILIRIWQCQSCGKKEMNKDINFFVAGSAHLDILSIVTGDSNTVDKIGNLEIAFGGTACNIAVNIVTSGFKVNFLSSMPNSVITSSIVDFLQSAGISPYIYYQEGLPESGFSSHIINGEMFSAVSSTPVEKVLIPDKIIKKSLVNVDVGVVDCNLSIETLKQIVRNFNHNNLPIYIAGVSEEKSLKIYELINLGFVFDAVFLNRKELAYLKNKVGFKDLSDSIFAKHLKTNFVITKDKDGVAVITKKGEQKKSPSFFVNNCNSLSGHFLGAGDALAAKTIIGVHKNDVEIFQSACQASRHVTSIMSQNNCNMGDGNFFEKHFQSLSEMAFFDSLTGLYNRRAFYKKSLSINNKVDCAILIYDIDHFKLVNDTYGHDIGDSVLIQLSKIIKKTFRSYDLNTRWGGEEFLTLLFDVSDKELVFKTAERFRELVEKTRFECGNITVSIGGSFLSKSFDLHKAIKLADESLYKAKKSGRNKVVLNTTEKGKNYA